MTTKKKAAGVLATPTTADAKTQPPIVADARVDKKAFTSLAAQHALCRHALVRARPDQSASFYEMRLGRIKPLASLKTAERFMRAIGGTR